MLKSRGRAVAIQVFRPRCIFRHNFVCTQPTFFQDQVLQKILINQAGKTLKLLPIAKFLSSQFDD
jgi:hypothetical protein